MNRPLFCSLQHPAYVVCHARDVTCSCPRLPSLRRFVTRAELSRLALEHLLGTPLLRAYMHGYFIDNRLYHKVGVLRVCFLQAYVWGVGVASWTATGHT